MAQKIGWWLVDSVIYLSLLTIILLVYLVAMFTFLLDCCVRER
jgi:hypothetical protein